MLQGVVVSRIKVTSKTCVVPFEEAEEKLKVLILACHVEILLHMKTTDVSVYIVTSRL